MHMSMLQDTEDNICILLH